VPRSPLARLRLLFLAAALVSLLSVPAAVATADHVGPAVRIGSIAALGILAIHWIAGYRRGGFSLIGELPEFVLLPVLAGYPGPALVLLFAMTFRSLYGGRVVTAVRALVYIGALCAGQVLIAGIHDVNDLIGKSVGLLVAGVLMQSLKGALQNLERSEQRLRAVVEHSTDVVSILGADLRIKWQAASIAAVLGHDPESLVGTEFVALVHPDDADMVRRHLASVAGQPGVSAPITARLRDVSGRYRHVEAVVGNRLHDPDIAGLLLNLRDATERRRLERERLSLGEQRARDEASRLQVERLRERVEAQRKRQELEAQLQRSQRLEIVGQLAGGVAHDFNNLLAAILNYATLIRAELPPSLPAQQDLAEIEDVARRGAKLVRHLMLFSQREMTTPEVLDLDAMIDGLGRLLERSLGEHVRLGYELEPGLWRIEADVSNIEQVLVNLIVNARDAVGDGGSVTVSTANVVVPQDRAVDLEIPAGPYVRLSVSDDGCGMDDATAARALEPFFTTKEVGKGTGLGLSTVFGVASRAGGGVELDSYVGEGTTVHVYVPPTDKPASDPELAEAGGSPAAGPECILLVEDEPAVRSTCDRILRRAGYTTVSAASGEEALRLLREHQNGHAFDLVLTDMVMPGMSGSELEERIRATTPGQRVLFMSAHTEDAPALRSADTKRLISKPFDSDALLRHVRDALDA
jgi:PAS domain S-box-containing protein